MRRHHLLTLSTVLLSVGSCAGFGLSAARAQQALTETGSTPPGLTGAPAWQALVGNTVVADTRVGSYTEYYGPDGTVRHLDKDGKTDGKWALQGEKICFDFADDDDRVCTALELSGSKGAFVDADGSRDTFTVLPGNAKNL